MKHRRCTLALAVVASAAFAVSAACRSEKTEKGAESATQQAKPAAEATGAPAAEATAAASGGPRRIEVKVDDKGYTPSSVAARAGEDLTLVFLRTSDSECVREVIVDGKTIELPLNKPVEVSTRMPTSGDLVFTCGMKMFEGRVAVAK